MAPHIKFRPLPPFELVNQLLAYNPETGDLHWRVSRGTAGAGAIAGSVSKRGYRTVMVNKLRIYAQRLAWLLFYGCEPTDFLDHINHNKSDNRIQNLRIVSNKENSWNRRPHSNNTSGEKGVFWSKGKWRAQVGCEHLGYFKDKKEAVACVRAARELLHGEFAYHG